MPDKLLDVSRSGAAIEYADFNSHDMLDEVQFDIFASESGYLMLRRVPCSVVYDVRVERPTLNGFETRRCGLKFKQLSDQHKDLFKILLNNYVSLRLPARYLTGARTEPYHSGRRHTNSAGVDV